MIAMADDVWGWCEKANSRGRTVTVKIKWADFQISTRSRSMETTIQTREKLHQVALVLLCHKLALWQQGQRGKRLAMLRASLMRMVAIDALMWRSARMGGSAWSITRGYERRLDDQGFVV